MTITLGSINISDNMYLDGVQSSKQVVHSQERTLDGVSVVRVKPTPGGRTLTLGSQSDGAIQGIWCSSTIDEVKALEVTAATVTLIYRGDSFLVVVVGTNFDPLFQSELEGPNKKYTGSITLLEV